MTRGGLPVRRYVAAALVAAAFFLALSMLDQRDVFLEAWGLSPAAPSVAATSGPAADAVRGFLSALGAAYAGNPSPLAGTPLSDGLRREVARELGHPVTRAAAAGLSLARFEVRRVEPRGGDAWEVATDETWTSPSGRRSRLRFRYRVVSGRVEEMTPLLPEP